MFTTNNLHQIWFFLYIMNSSKCISNLSISDVNKTTYREITYP